MSDRQTRWLFAVILFAQLTFLTAQVRDESGERSRFEAMVLGGVAPISHLTAWGASIVDGFGDRFASRKTLSQENRLLRAETDRMRKELLRLYGIEQDLERLSEAVEYQRAATRALQVADIVYIDSASWLKSLIVFLAQRPAVVNQPVVAKDGLVGRVVLASGSYAKVQLISDRAAGIGVMVERSRRQGLVRGVGSAELSLDFIPLQADVRVGDVILTAGIDGIYPRGIPVGRVMSVKPGNELFRDILVTPAVDLGSLDQVYVLETETIPQEMKSEVVDAGS